ncbi:fibroblast growth factor 1 [Halyomorpha halys]|uniref:fibroblast growth factor 1 n=1 Tax=Halyomorpha halys TaxID=286706 RepID=UPI0006D51866|nr:fibroblast growth factor 1 [Halyomorpha halys]
MDIHDGNPHYGYRMRLYCRTGHHLTILPDEKIVGINDDAGDLAEYEILEFTSAGNIGEVRIRGVYSNLYLCMDDEGNLYGEENPREEATIFIESTLRQYNTYLSKKHEDKNWFVGIKKNGKPKPAVRTAWGQKAIQFLPIRVE